MKENTKKLIGATATPLASIFGSGFLVIVPILNGAVGPYSLIAMTAVCHPIRGGRFLRLWAVR